MIGAEECRIVLADRFAELEESGIPDSVLRAMVRNQTAGILILGQDGSVVSEGEAGPGASCLLLAPVLIDGAVAALILARRSCQPSSSFYDSDLQLVLAASNQIALSIRRHRVDGRLFHTSNHDGLTDLPNRNLFLERVRDAIARARRHEEAAFAVLFFDIDNFKIVNDSLGHLLGDKLLIAISDRLRRNVREIDTVARTSIISRFGGDEFAILLDDIADSRSALAAATRIKEFLSRPYEIDGKELAPTMSIGVALSSREYAQADEILRDADIAMYRAKELGKDRIELYDKAMHAHVLRRMRIGNALRQGALQKEFRLHYQPIVSLKDGRIAGHEALLRWYTATGDLLSPADFMDAIDTAGLLHTADQWVLETACRQAMEWLKAFPADPPLFMSVNISSKYFRHPSLVENIRHVLETTGLDPTRLWLEITESVGAGDDESAIAVLKELHALGVRISLDDFGAGYSALNYLARFPIDALKIDRSLIGTIGVQEESGRVIDMIKALATHLGLLLIAEGVESSRELAFLYSMHCDYVQGYYLARPADAETATRALSQGPRWLNQASHDESSSIGNLKS
jgi:diguanylate cyclase (GGDEF)-like protein